MFDELGSYAPELVQDYVFSEPDTKDTLVSLVEGIRKLPNQSTFGLLLHGPAGTGKTSIARLLPYWIEQKRQKTCLPNIDFRQESCVSGTGAETVNIVKRNLELISLCEIRYILLDEIDQWQDVAQKNLKSVMTEFGKFEINFFICTTNHLDKVEDPIRNRLQEVRMEKIKPSNLLPVAVKIFKHKGKLLTHSHKKVLEEELISNGINDYRKLSKFTDSTFAKLEIRRRELQR